MIVPARLSLLAIGAAVLLAGLHGGLQRIGAVEPVGTLALGVVALAGTNLLWLSEGLSPAVAFGWIGFLVLVIGGERLELGRILQHGALVKGWFAFSVIGILTALALAQIAQPFALGLVGASLLALATWLFLFDVARRTVRGRGLTRFMAIALLAGYAWLAIAGALLLSLNDPLAGFRYDAVLHCIFVSFAFSMVFAHAAVIFPALTRIELPYRPRLYLPLMLLHLSLGARLIADLMEMSVARAFAGALNAVAILLFLVLQAAFALLRPPRPISPSIGPVI